MKLPYMDEWDVTPAEIELMGGLSRDGSPKVLGSWTGKVNFSETAKRIQDGDGTWVKLSGVLRVKGDILPNISYTTGKVKVMGIPHDLTIVAYSRPRNPDGSVNHTRIEVI